MNNINGFIKVALAGITGLTLSGGLNSAIAVELPNGQTAFTQSPHLLKTSATNNAVNTFSSYRFTIKVPEGVGEPLKAIRIKQQDNIETIQFREQSTRAFVGTQARKKSELTLAAVGGRREPGVVNVVFKQPIQPGNTVTISISPKRNPSTENIYQFGVTAFPDGEKGRGQFLGYGRVSFYSYR